MNYEDTEDDVKVLPRYLVSFVDKRDKRKYTYVISSDELPESLRRIPNTQDSRISMETRIWTAMFAMFPHVRFSQMELQALASPFTYDNLKLQTATELFPG